MRRQQHGLVAGQVGLGRQHVQALRARDARRGFQREAGQAGGRQPHQAFGVERVQHAGHHGARLHVGQFLGGRRAHLQHQSGPQRILGRAQGRAGGLVGLVQISGGDARPAFHYDSMLAGRVLLDGFRCCCDTGFPVSGFFWYPDVHRRLSSEGSRIVIHGIERGGPQGSLGRVRVGLDRARKRRFRGQARECGLVANSKDRSPAARTRASRVTPSARASRGSAPPSARAGRLSAGRSPPSDAARLHPCRACG